MAKLVLAYNFSEDRVPALKLACMLVKAPLKLFQGPVCASTMPDICIVPVSITAVMRQRHSDIS